MNCFPSAAAMPSKTGQLVPHQVLALVRDVLSQFCQEAENVEELRVAARSGWKIRGCVLWEPAAFTLFGPVDDRAIVGDPREVSELE
jgi:hypothetical protein